ncbi:MAG: 4Fe-4S binding protein [Deltaproteobacteria bacterium]|nr:4Fe-4S binding protein [Deltaproteobacteria bacterium]
MARKTSLLQRIANRRRAAQIGLGVLIWVAVGRYDLSLWWVIGFGSLAGVLFGKFFCRWMCPLGAVMETVMGTANQEGMYQYFKVGCPIAWVSGLLNRVSFLRINHTKSSCVSCGKCDAACYITQFNPEYSLYKEGHRNPSTHYACSRCLQCVSDCPIQTINLAPAWTDARKEVALRGPTPE